jgi:hypothetical protein
MTNIAALLDEAPAPHVVHRDRARAAAKQPKHAPNIQALLDEAPAPHEVQVPAQAAGGDDLEGIAAAAGIGAPKSDQIGGTDEELTQRLAAADAPGGTFNPDSKPPEFPVLRENSHETIPQGIRAKASFKGTQTGVLNYLRHQYGKDNVEPVLSKPKQIRDASGGYIPDPEYKPEIVNYRIRLTGADKDADGKEIPGKVVMFDPKGFDFGDVTDLSGDTVEVVPSIVGSVVGGAVGAAGGGTAGSIAGPAGTAAGAAAGGTKGAMIGGAIGAGVGSAARQAIGAMLPGDENMTATDRLISGGANVAGSVIGEGVGRLGSKAIGAVLNPVERIAGRNAAREVVEPVAQHVATDAVADAAAHEAPAAAEQVVGRKPFSMVPDEAAPVPMQSQENAGSAAAGINSGKLRGREAAAGNMQLAKDTGIPFTPGQLTGGKEQIAFERTIAQLPGGRDIMHAGDVNRAKALSTFVDKTIKASSGESVGADAAARTVANARKVQMEHLAEMRTKAANAGFGAARAAGGEQKIVPINNTLRVIDELQKEYGGAISSDSADAITKKLAEIKKGLVGALDREEVVTTPGNAYRTATSKTVQVPGRAEDVRVSVQQLQNDLRNFGKQAAGAGSFIKDLHPSVDRGLSAKIFGALQQDLGAAADSGDGLLSKATGGLKQARDVYRTMSQAMQEQDDVIFKRVTDLIDKGDAPEKLITALASGGDNGTFVPSQVKKTMATLIGTPSKPGINPTAGLNLRGAVLEKMIEGTRPNVNSALGSADVAISPKQFATMATKNANRIKALFHGDPEGYAAWQKAAQAARMLGEDAGINGGSQTAPMMAIRGLFDAMTTIGPRAVTAPIETAKSIIKEGAAKANAKTLAQVFNNPEARNIYLGLANPKRNITREQVIAGMAKITAVIQRDKRLFSDAPDNGDKQPQPDAGTAVADRGKR